MEEGGGRHWERDIAVTDMRGGSQKELPTFISS